MIALPIKSSLIAYKIVDRSWISSSTNCTFVDRHFRSNVSFITFKKIAKISELYDPGYSTEGDNYRFVCPTTDHTALLPVTEDHVQFLLYFPGKRFEAAVFKVDQDALLECAHSLLPLEASLVDATGGVLRVPGETDEPVPVVCGGEFIASSDNRANDKCMIINSEEPLHKSVRSRKTLTANGILNHFRIGAASTVIDNGYTLWVTGGKLEDAQRTTELVGSIGSNPDIIYDTNGAGPLLPGAELTEHCLTKVGPKTAMLIGGTNEIAGEKGG